jgi:hypothetical protein
LSLAKCVLNHLHARVVCVGAVQDAAKQLLQSDYALLPLEPRLALLRCLTDFAFVSELARAHLDARNEAYAQVRGIVPDNECIQRHHGGQCYPRCGDCADM